MSNLSQLSHIAVLVTSVERSADILRSRDFVTQAPEHFEGEGTLEIYVGDQANSARLLLMEPTRPGDYARALERRGPGLHHIAIDVSDLESYLQGLAAHGWFLHLNSIEFMRRVRTAYLVRPGFPGLIEVHERKTMPQGPPLIEKFSVSVAALHQDRLRALGVRGLVPSGDTDHWIHAMGQQISVSSILS